MSWPRPQLPRILLPAHGQPHDSKMKQSLRTKLDQLSARMAELDGLLSAEDATRDIDRYRALTRERAEIDPVVGSISSPVGRPLALYCNVPVPV